MKKDRGFLFLRQNYTFLSRKSNVLLYPITFIILIALIIFSNLQNQVANFTWIYSSSMQTLAAIIALLPISYSYYLRKVEDEKGKHYDGYILKKLEKDVYYEMMFVIIFSIITIFINLFFLFSIYEEYLAIIATAFTLYSMQFVIVYIYRLFDPDRVKQLLKEFDQSTRAEPSLTQFTLDQFITSYLNLERAVKDFISNERDNELVDGLPLYDIVDELSKDFPEIEQYYDDFKEIIFHRNNLIHNYTDTVVDEVKYQKIKDLTDYFEQKNTKFIADKIFTNVTTVKQNITSALQEYLHDFRTKDGDLKQNQVGQFEETLAAILQAHFVSDYYKTITEDEALDVDFAVIQNNYSNKLLVGVELKMTDYKHFIPLKNAFFNRMKNKYLYPFIINYNLSQNSFQIAYKTKQGKEQSDTISE
jgi:hypothetical protein